MVENRQAYASYSYEKKAKLLPERVSVGSDVVPVARQNERMSITLSVFQDHGRPAYIGSTISSSETLVDAANQLSNDQQRHANRALSTAYEQYLDEGAIRANAVFSSRTPGKPDIYVITIGEPYDKNNVKLFCHPGAHRGKPVLFRDAVATKNGIRKVEQEFRQGGYKPPKDWDSKKGYSRRH